MPFTPEVARPIGRSASSVAVKRIDCAFLLISSRSSSEETSSAPISSSAPSAPSAPVSRRLIAMTPPERGES